MSEDPRRRGNNIVPLRQPAEPLAAPDRFRPFFASQLEGYVPKPRSWIIDGVLLRRTVCLFAGPPKTGKSLLLQQLLTSTAAGLPWLGREVVQARAFGLFTEDPDEEIKRRQIDINADLDRAPADFELDLAWDAREGKDALLVEFEKFTDRPKFTPLWDQLWSFVEDGGFQVVGIDPTGVIFGGNENWRSQVTNFMRELVKKAVKIDGAIILSAHPSKSGPTGFSGSGAWLASSRFGMNLGRPPDYDPETGQPANARVLRGLGSNYSAGMTSERLEWRDGVFSVVEPENQSRTRPGPLTQTERMDLRYRLLIGLKRVLQNGATVPADEISPQSMPNRARRSSDPQINRVSLNDLNLAQADLIEAGQVVRVEVKRRCLIRPSDGPYYEGEEAWVERMTPPEAR